MTTTETRTDNYTLHWTLFFGLIAALVSLYWVRFHPMALQPRTQAVSAATATNTFLVLHLPEVPLQEATTEFIKGKMAVWLSTLKRENFHILTLADVRERLARGESLPERTLVLVFDPGYRHTYEILSPIFQAADVPAVWLTVPNRGGAVDRRYLSSHVLGIMRNSGKWDVGVYNRAGTVEFMTPNGTEVVRGLQGLWNKNSGRAALNLGIEETGLNRLHANVQWSDRELVDRLLAEMPVHETSFLTTRKIQNRTWGLVMTGVDSNLARFSLRPAIDKRAASMSWAGTRGIKDLDVKLDAASVYGELWLSLRVDESAGEGVSIGFSSENIMIEEEFNHVRERLETVPASIPTKPFSALVLLTGTKLTVQVDGQDPIQFDHLKEPTSKNGVVRLTAFDRINGMAQADWITLRVTPSHPTPAQTQNTADAQSTETPTASVTTAAPVESSEIPANQEADEDDSPSDSPADSPGSPKPK